MRKRVLALIGILTIISAIFLSGKKIAGGKQSCIR